MRSNKRWVFEIGSGIRVFGHAAYGRGEAVTGRVAYERKWLMGKVRPKIMTEKSQDSVTVGPGGVTDDPMKIAEKERAEEQGAASAAVEPGQSSKIQGH